MPSRWDSATCGRRRRVFHYPPPTLMSRNFRLPCAIELQPLSLTPLKMRKVELGCHDLIGNATCFFSLWLRDDGLALDGNGTARRANLSPNPESTDGHGLRE